ncbi:MAG: PH domain-containing protein [Anaerolineales bacterium]
MQTTQENWTLFLPPRRKGVLILASLLLAIVVLIVFLLVSAVSQGPGLPVVFLLLGAFLLTLPVPVLLYRLYALVRSSYWVGRNGLRLRMGLRFVNLPFSDVLDVALPEELETPLALPRFAFLGSLTGKLADAELGKVEFLASDASLLVLLGTREGVIVISPANAREFIDTYKRESERGSLHPIAAYSVSPSFVLVDAWAQPRVPALLVTGALLALGLLILVGVLAPGLEAVSLGFGADGQPLEAVAGVQLFLLPALNLFFYMGNFVLGLVFFREPQGLRFSYLLWGSSLLSSFLFLGAILFIM